MFALTPRMPGQFVIQLKPVELLQKRGLWTNTYFSPVTFVCLPTHSSSAVVKATNIKNV